MRDEKVIPLEEAIRKLTSLPADDLQHRPIAARSQPGYFADVVVFDPATIADHATFEKPHQYADGVRHVFVNGVQVLRDGEHTGAKPGRVVRGPGWKGLTQARRAERQAVGGRPTERGSHERTPGAWITCRWPCSIGSTRGMTPRTTP